ncbi:MAG: methyltransferase [Candidatus Micrarchaeota archaeon]
MRLSLSKGVFYNPQMRFCRSMSSLAVGAIGEKLEVVDAFCASGIRGIRYAKENKNVRKLTSLDIEKSAIALAKKNAKANRVKHEAVVGNVSRMAFGLDADFLEIDPFGTPSPYLVDAFRFFNTKKEAYLSVTATDVAVLCGGKTAPCMKNYHSKPMNNEFTHETGLRIMLKKIAETAAEFNMGIGPLVSFSDRHYLKAVLHVKRGADLAYESMKMLGYVSYCARCGWRGSGKFPEKCQNCRNPEPKTGNIIRDAGSPLPDAESRVPETMRPSAASSQVPAEPKTDYAGPLWLGGLHEPDFVRRMAGLNAARGYSDKEELAGALALMAGETGMPPYYYNVHALCKLARSASVPAMGTVLDSLRAAGHRAVKTHFSPICIKTDAPYGAVKEAVGWRS